MNVVKPPDIAPEAAPLPHREPRPWPELGEVAAVCAEFLCLLHVTLRAAEEA